MIEMDIKTIIRGCLKKLQYLKGNREIRSLNSKFKNKIKGMVTFCTDTGRCWHGKVFVGAQEDYPKKIFFKKISSLSTHVRAYMLNQKQTHGPPT